MRFVGFIFTLLLSVIGLSCEESFSTSTKLSYYNINSPDKIFELPPILQEISGLTLLDDGNIACIQDEKGIVFTYKLQTKSITNEFRFSKDGDYEDIAKVGNTLYILRSDGVLFEFADYDKKNAKSTIHKTNIPAKDIEGLYYDSSYNRLLIATKSKIKKNTKAIFSFDLKTKSMVVNPIYSFNTKQLEIDIRKKGIKIGIDSDKLKFKMSAISINPKNGNLYVLSAAEYLIFVFDKKGTLLEVSRLDPKIYTKAEGITFYENGDMLISNEGESGKPSIVLIKYLSNKLK